MAWLGEEVLPFVKSGRHSAAWLAGEKPKTMRKDLEELLSPERFSPFVITANDGFSIAVDSPSRCLLGARMLVVSDAEGNLFHFPFIGIAHISEPNGKSAP